MDLTTNFGLGKPDPLENYDVAVRNTNMDIVDAALQTLTDGAVPAEAVSFTPEMRTDTGGSGVASSGSGYWLRIGNLAVVAGSASPNADLTNASIMLPAAAGTPVFRQLVAGLCGVFGASPPSQSGFGTMNTGKDRVTVTDWTQGYRNCLSTQTVRFLLVYMVEPA